MDIDVNQLMQKLSAQIAAQAQQIAILQVQVEELQKENEQLKETENRKEKNQ